MDGNSGGVPRHICNELIEVTLSRVMIPEAVGGVIGPSRPGLAPKSNQHQNDTKSSSKKGVIRIVQTPCPESLWRVEERLQRRASGDTMDTDKESRTEYLISVLQEVP